MALTKKAVDAPVEATQKAVAFVNWQLAKNDGSVLRSSKGFPIFQNPKYPNSKEDILVALAKRNGGSISVTMEVMISINNATSAEEFDLDSIVTLPGRVQPAPTELLQ